MMRHSDPGNLTGDAAGAAAPNFDPATGQQSAPAGEARPNLDPADWERFRANGHEILDQLVDWLRDVRERPVWQPVPDGVRAAFDAPLPRDPGDLEAAWQQLTANVLPYTGGNTHPRFWGWVQGTGTPVGMLAELIAGAVNGNLGGRDHAPVYVERQVVDWSRRLFDLPDGTSGVLVSGTSMATVVCLAAARRRATEGAAGTQGLARYGHQLVAYASSEAHVSARKALELLGIGAIGLRSVGVKSDFTMNVEELERTIADDVARGYRPLCVVASAGTVNTGALDDLAAIADVCERQNVWLHVDAAFGAGLAFSGELRPRLAGIERADSVAFDFHKWMHVPYAVGCALVRDGALHRATFAAATGYLQREGEGLAGGDPWFCDYGPELSRSFLALKVWLTLTVHGADAIGAMVEKNCAQARELEALVNASPQLELVAPVTLNVVCFRYVAPGATSDELDRLNSAIVTELQVSGVAAPSLARVAGRMAIRVAITNHRTDSPDLRVLVDAVLATGRTLFPHNHAAA